MTLQSQPVIMSSTTEERVIYVDAKAVHCTGVLSQECLQVRENPEDEWILFYDAIKGFEYEPGYNYKLLIAEKIMQNPPLDASLFQWSLVEVLSKTPVESYEL